MEHRLHHLIFDLVGHDASEVVADGAAVALMDLLRSPYFEGAHQDTWKLIEYRGRITVAQHVRDEWRLRHPLELYGHSHSPLMDVQPIDDVPEAAEQAARQILDQVRECHADVWQQLRTPTPEQRVARYTLRYELLDDKALDARLEQVLGETYRLDGSLATQGIEYHTAPGWIDRDMRYILAHNGQEIAGILGLSNLRPWTYGVNYLAVAPGFRKRGVGRGLFAGAIDACVADGRVLVRTSPGEYTYTRPAITAAFDQMCQQAPVLHVQANSYLMSAVGRALERMPITQAMEYFKPLCDRFDVVRAGDLWDHSVVKLAIQEVEARLPGPGARHKRKSP